MPSPYSFDTELVMLRAQINREAYLKRPFRFPSPKSLKYVNALFDKGLRSVEESEGLPLKTKERQALRKAIVAMLVQEPELETTYELSQYQVSTLIEYGRSSDDWRPNARFIRFLGDCRQRCRSTGDP